MNIHHSWHCNGPRELSWPHRGSCLEDVSQTNTCKPCITVPSKELTCNLQTVTELFENCPSQAKNRNSLNASSVDLIWSAAYATAQNISVWRKAKPAPQQLQGAKPILGCWTATDCRAWLAKTACQGLLFAVYTPICYSQPATWAAKPGCFSSFGFPPLLCKNS